MERLILARMLSIDSKTPQKSYLSKRRSSVTLPVHRPSYFANEKMAPSPAPARKGVRFPVSVLLQQAITEGDMAEMQQLLKDYGYMVVEEREPSGLPPIMRAIFEDQLDPLKFLVKAGAKLTSTDPEGWNVLHVASAMDNIEAAKFVIGACNEPLTHVRNIDGQRPIDLAESPEMARFLLHADLQDLRIEADTTGELRDTNEDQMVNTLTQNFEESSNSDFLNIILQGTGESEFDSILHLAAARNYSRLARYILKHQLINPNCRDRMGWTPIHVATYYGSVDVLILLTEFGGSVHSLTNAYEKSSDFTDVELILDILKDQEQLS